MRGEETQAVLNELDDYLYTYHRGRSGPTCMDGENSQTEADGFEYSQQNFSDVDDDATQLPDLPAYNGNDFESQPIL